MLYILDILFLPPYGPKAGGENWMTPWAADYFGQLRANDLDPPLQRKNDDHDTDGLAKSRTIR